MSNENCGSLQSRRLIRWLQEVFYTVTVGSKLTFWKMSSAVPAVKSQFVMLESANRTENRK